MRSRALLSIALLLAGCRPVDRPADHPPGRPEPAANASSPAVAAVCDTVAALWRATGHADVRQVDTALTVASEPATRRGCAVVADAPDGPGSGQAGALYWTLSRSRGWREIPEYTTDGPDGGSQTLERSGIRCQIDFSRDGGDDSDSTYLPRPAIRETTFCWDRSG